MPLTFNMLLREASIPLDEVRLLRHKDHRADKGRSIYELWRDHRDDFEKYQSLQGINGRRKLSSRFWASFVGTPDDRTLFVGLYLVKHLGVLECDVPAIQMEAIVKAGTADKYQLERDSQFTDLEGRLFVDWGEGKRSWVQRADRQDKRLLELRMEFKEPEFPGFLNFIKPLSQLSSLPLTWISALKSCHGVYLLTCPKTKQQYVGKADGYHGFWGRWQDYVQSGHGGNTELKIRDPSDYQVCILEVAGTSTTASDIIAMENKWKEKLQSREMGLNRN